MLILGIESSCDETAAAVVKDGREVLSNVINTQIALHKKFGGVVPEVASRRHIETIDAVIDEALEEANVTFDDIDAIAVTYGPGLVGALLVGVSTAKALSFALKMCIRDRDWSASSSDSLSFEDKLSKFKQDSDEKMQTLRRNNDSKRSGGYSRKNTHSF